jgi:3-methyladenine DNA glycosylase AlkD
MKLTAEQFIKELKKLISKTELKKYERYFPLDKRNGDKFIGVQMGKVFALAREFIEMPLDEIEKLLESPIHEIRTGAVSIMDFQARSKKTSNERRKELYDLYIRRHDRINNWDLVDRSAIYVVGGYLFEYQKPGKILYKLARSKNSWERRTAIVSTAYFIKNSETGDTFKIAELLVNDKDEFVNKATGWMLRYAGDKDKKRLLNFLDKYTAKMPGALLRNAIEKLDKKQRDHYLGMKKGKAI